VLIGGGYGTGREVVEFFSRHGLVGGFLGICVATAGFALIFGLSFDLARRSGNYEYAAFFRTLIGRFWWTFEVLYIALALLVLSVLGAAAGDILKAEFGIPTLAAVSLTLGLIMLVVLFGRAMLERILTAWTGGMYFVFALYFYFVFASFNGIAVEQAKAPVFGEAVIGGALYVMYNSAIAPVLLFATRAISTQREAYLSGAFTALLLTLPATFFHLSFSLADDTALKQPVPVYFMIDSYAPNSFRVLFVLAIVGTLIQTGAGLIHGFIERVEHALRPAEDDTMSGTNRLLIAAAALTVSWLLAKVGIIALIARGYTTLGLAFAAVYIAPLIFRRLIGGKK